AQAKGLVELLEKLGYGLEPDVRLGGPSPTAFDRAVLFRVPPEAAGRRPDASYFGVVALVELAAAIAAASGRIEPSEAEPLEKLLEGAVALAAADLLRLKAHLRWVLACGQKSAALGRRLSSLKPKDRTALGEFLVTAAGLDGQVTPDKMKLVAEAF